MRSSLLAAALAALGLLLGAGSRSSQDAELLTTSAAGSFSLSNSLQGSAIFSADDIGPGDTVGGSVTIANTGTLRTAVRLAQDTVADVPGPGGGALSNRLDLQVRDVTDPSAPVALYGGRLAAMPELSVGVLGAGESRSYEFSVTLRHGTGDDAFEGSTVSVRYLWGAGEPPPAEPDPAQPWPQPGAPGLGPAPSTGTTLRDLPPTLRLRLPSNWRAVKRRRFVAYARCGEACELQARARFPARRGGWKAARRLRLARVGAHRWVRLAFRVPRASVRPMKRALRLHGRTSIRLTVAARDSAGNTKVAKRRALLRKGRGRGRA